MKRIFNIKIFYFIILSLLLSTQSIAGGRVIPETQLSVVYPSTFDANKCDQVPFSGTIASLALPGIPLTAIFSTIQPDPMNKRYGLVVELIQRAVNYANVRIEGDKAILEDIENKMIHGYEVRLTEFRQCAESDKSLKLVELINFTPSLKSLAPALNAKIEYIKKNDQGVCAITASKTLGDLVKLYNPTIDLASIEANISIEASGWSENGKLTSKNLQITFNNKNNIFEQLKSPSISIRLPKDLGYTAIQRLNSPKGILQMTGTPDCKGQRPDDPVWIYGLNVS